MSCLSLKRVFVLLVAAAMFAPVNALAAAGKAIFVYGSATIVSEDGTTARLAKGDAVESGDTIVTAANGRVQIQMVDGGLLALRPGTEFRIEKFSYPQAAATDEAAAAEPASFFELVKGGFRSITGAIGKSDKQDYRVRTPVATIGIRGTDYDALYCAGDCQAVEKSLDRSIDDGLYVGVNSGGVRLSNDAGFVDLDVGDHGFASGPASAPAKSDIARDILAPATSADVNEQAEAGSTASVGESAPDTGLEATDSSGNPIDLNDGGELPVDNSGQVAFSGVPGAGTGAVPAGQANQVFDASGSLSSFTVGDVTYERGSAQSVNVGRDTDRPNATGLSWGRWADGQVNITEDGQTTQVPLDGSVHWIAGDADAPTPAVPTTGSLSFSLVGNTDPTDNSGNVGTLGSATLDADFDAQTVDADVSLSFDQTNQVWDAAAEDVDINSADATFAGEFDSVTITDGDSGTVQDGSGDLGGFFTGNDAGDVTGAGMSYSLSDDAGVDVSGSAAFEARPGSD